MNDPHVVELVYGLVPQDGVDYRTVPPAQWKTPDFELAFGQEEFRFKLKRHYTTENEARQAVAKYIRAWEFDAQIARGHYGFRLDFKRSEIVDRNPTPGSVALPPLVFETAAVSTAARLSVSHSAYPPPPSDLAVTPDVEVMWQRFMMQRSGREPLASMAYWCLTKMEHLAVDPGDAPPGTNRRKAAADKFRISPELLKQIGRLSSTRGARKAQSKRDFSPVEREFLVLALRRAIRRVAEIAHDSEREPERVHCDSIVSGVAVRLAVSEAEVRRQLAGDSDVGAARSGSSDD